jgi:hypothetical protein
MNAKFKLLIAVEIISEIKNKRQYSSPSLHSRQMTFFVLLPKLKQMKIFSVALILCLVFWKLSILLLFVCNILLVPVIFLFAVLPRLLGMLIFKRPGQSDDQNKHSAVELGFSKFDSPMLVLVVACSSSVGPREILSSNRFRQQESRADYSGTMALLRQYIHETWQRPSQWNTPNSRDRRKHDKLVATSNQCQFVYLTLRAWCPNSTDSGRNIPLRGSEKTEWKPPGQISKIVAQQILGPTWWKLKFRLLCGSYWLQRTRQ